uniref:Uncharacterized protein n=1 Tax=Amicula sp. isolate GU52X-4 cfCalB7 TaxID=3003489 RepID=A0A9E9C3K6_9STRA|nr:hypothetical protein [Amicula sp. isolate GU52X-4 cfCalB7]
MKYKKKNLVNYNIGSCLASLFGRYVYVESKSFKVGYLFLSILFLFSFFGSLLLIGNPYLSLSIMFVCFLFLCWNFCRLIQTDLSFLIVITLACVITFLYFVSGEFIFFILLAIKIAVFFFIFSLFLTFFYPKMVKFTRIGFVLFLVSILTLGLFLGLVKLYLFNAAVFFTSNHTQELPLLFSDVPSNVYLAVRNYDFLGIQKNALFILDFSSDSRLNDFAVQLGRFNQTRSLFNYVFQLLCLDASWFPFHLTLVFT